MDACSDIVTAPNEDRRAVRIEADTRDSTLNDSPLLRKLFSREVSGRGSFIQYPARSSWGEQNFRRLSLEKKDTSKLPRMVVPVNMSGHNLSAMLEHKKNLAASPEYRCHAQALDLSLFCKTRRLSLSF